MRKECREQGERLGKGPRAQVGTCKEGRKCSQMCQRALTQKRTLSGGGALQFGDLRLLEDGGEHGGALGSNVVAGEAARDR